MEFSNEKQTMLSMIKPTGHFTLGNYLGALKNWVKLQDEYNSIFAVADLHAITIRIEPAKLRQQTLTAYGILNAIGLDPEKSLMFIQSTVPAHAELSWILSCYAQYGEMQRMTQFKDKSKKAPDNVNLGLFSYPSLMNADILLYGADVVPVGVDQKQHVELCRTVANRFNGIYGDTFKVPEPIIPKVGAKIMSLQNPTEKMGKSDTNENAYVKILDDPDTIMRKFKRAVTDSEAKVYFGDATEKAGINNLMTIYSAVTGLDFDKIEKEFDGKGYGDFKVAVAEAVIEELRPVRERFDELMGDKAQLEAMYKDGAEKASYLARKTLSKVKRKVGFVK
ncbi:MAG: tryptophan--tRNA ligase [Clostridia bacterium]|nr:tryptophan--tRNA ligase [Clostridia bacterium]